jgi:hypothetical protein
MLPLPGAIPGVIAGLAVRESVMGERQHHAYRHAAGGCWRLFAGWCESAATAVVAVSTCRVPAIPRSDR